MIESSGKLITEELVKAGTDPELIERLKKDRITIDKELPPMEFLLKLFDVPCCPRGELVAFTGKAKSGKTFVMSMMMAAIDLCHPDLVILDGVRDLVDDINNGQLAHEVTERLMKVAQQARCCIVCVIHQNKAAEDRTLRGSIGTELTNKAFEVYECEKLMPSRTFVMTQKLTRKYDIVDSLYFTVDDRGLPRQVGAPQTGLEMTVITADGIARQTGLKTKYLIVHEDGSWEVDYRLLFRDALTNQGELCGGELRDRVMGLCGMKNRFQYGELLEKAKAAGILSMRKAGKKHYYWLAPD